MTMQIRHRTTIPTLLKQIRMEQGLSKLSVATRMGKTDESHQLIGHWEEGVHEPRLSSLEAWADALGYEIDLHPKS